MSDMHDWADSIHIAVLCFQVAAGDYPLNLLSGDGTL